MKSTVHVAALLAMTLCLAACTEKQSAEITPPYDGKTAATFFAGVSTRAIGTYWDNDQIGVIVTNATTSTMASEYCNVPYTTTSESTTATFTADSDEIYFEDASETVSFSAYGPYYTTAAITIGPVKISGDTSTQTSQDKTATYSQQKIDYIYSTASTTEANPVVGLEFKHVMSQLIFNVVHGSGFAASDVTSATYSLTGINHNGYFDLDTTSDYFGTAYSNGSADATAWSLSTNCYSPDTATTNYDKTFSAIVFPQTVTTFTFEAKIGLEDFTVDLSSHLSTFAAGNSYVFNLTVSEGELSLVDCYIDDWTPGGSYDITFGGSAE